MQMVSSCLVWSGRVVVCFLEATLCVRQELDHKKVIYLGRSHCLSPSLSLSYSLFSFALSHKL